MKTDTIKISFITSIIFHSIVIYIFASHLSPVKNTAMNITPIEILNIEDKNPSEQIENKMEDTPFYFQSAQKGSCLLYLKSQLVLYSSLYFLQGKDEMQRYR